MRGKFQLSHWLNYKFIGFQDEGEGTSSEGSEESDDGSGDQGESNEDSGNEGLKSALRKERQSRRDLEKQLKALSQFKDDTEAKDKSEVEKATAAATKAAAQVESLRKGFREVAIDSAVTKAATQLKFRDIDDALRLINRDDLDIDHDEDDPSKVVIDPASIDQALKALAKAKPHLIQAEGSEERTGSKFNGGKKSQDELDDDAVRSRYPALARGFRQ